MTDDIMTRVWDAYWSDEDAKRGTQAALERVVGIVREEQSSRIAALEAENADIRSGEYLVRVIEERERLRKALEYIKASQNTNHGCMATILQDISRIASDATATLDGKS